MIDVNTLPACPVETTLTLISDKWKILIVRDLLTGTKRFSELRRSGAHLEPATDGSRRTCASRGLPRSAAARRILSDRHWP